MQAHIARDQVIGLAWECTEDGGFLRLWPFCNVENFLDRFGFERVFCRIEGLSVSDAEFLRDLICYRALRTATNVQVGLHLSL